MASKFSGNGAASGLMRLSELGQQVGGVVEAGDAPQVFQLFAVGRCGQDPKLRAAGFESMRGFGERVGIANLYCRTNFFHEHSGVVHIRGEDFRQNIGTPRALKRSNLVPGGLVDLRVRGRLPAFVRRFVCGQPVWT